MVPGSEKFVRTYLEGVESLVAPDTANILMSHNPDTFDRAAELGIDLSLAGHTHGGQVALEFVSPEIAPSRLVTPYVAGWFQKPGGQLYVNRGIGTIGVPMRIGAPPEITVYEKWHTDFMGKIESGLFKMIAIGLGKFAGAQHYHTYAYKLGLENTIRAIGRTVLESGKILGGLAILEDANHNTAKLEAVPVEGMEQREEELLALAKSWMGRIPMDLDILILDEIGKNVSGAGMDTKVVNRSVLGDYNPWPDTPRIERIFVRDLSDLTYNNAVGIGMADVVTDRLVDRIDWVPTRVNSLTASTPSAIRTPIHSPPTASAWKPLLPRSASSMCAK
jgi:hypothetical protein